MTRAVQLVRELVARIPEFEDLYVSHEFNNEGVLPHLFFWEVVGETIDSYLGKDSGLPDWRKTLLFLEDQSSLGISEVNEIIVTSFLDKLPFPGSPGCGIVEHLGPVMAGKFARIRPAG
ncbi:hypothetical protein [Streptomyces sp. H39-C1]|uniref:hypothetical protein n=1 Tax=Streptomyces sp. H39-C1 TaxID=3004355 RepID=UPI0022AE667F|nr:hypothetical protein [Streptomyces sp. H39-C1]MCZ4099792.1 hypothetical protein [Streptomyces sp. H39-C1]